MRTTPAGRTRRTATAVAPTLLLLAALSGCAGATAGPATGSGVASDALGVWQRFAACARAHGVPDLPDPLVAADGRVTFPGFTNRSQFGPAQAACKPILAGLGPQASPRSAGAPTDIPALLRFAQCMRTHGFADWPDPKSDGTFPGNQLPAMKTPALLAAMGECDHLNPDSQGRIYGS